MVSVLIGFGVIVAVIAIGYVVGRTKLLDENAGHTLGRLTFFVLSPALLFTVMADADTHDLFSTLLIVSVSAALIVFLIFGLIARFVWHRKLPEVVVGALSSGYVNAGNIGIPVAVYVLGDAAASAPVILFQLIFVAPISLTILDLATRGRVSLGRVLTQPFRNPIIIGALLGLVLTVTGVSLPDPVMEPFRLLGAAAVPVILITFGMSISGSRILAPKSGRRDVLLATALKVVVMPAAAWAIAHFVLGLTGQALFIAVVLAALPTAQNVFNYAQRYQRGEIVARDTVLISTVAAIPILVLIAALLAP